MSSSNCCFLTCIQVSQDAGQVIWYSHLLKNFPQFVVIYTVKGFGIVNKAEIDVFLELFCFLDDSMDVVNLISGSSAFSKTSLNIWKFTVHILLKPGLENFGQFFTSVSDECNCAVVWAFFGNCLSLGLDWFDGPKNWCFWTVVLEKILESPLDCKEIQPAHPKGNQPWIFIARTDVEAETPILWPPDAKNWLSWKDPDAGKDWGQ